MEIHIQKGGQKQGPFSEAQIRSGVDAGEFAPDDLAWSTGKASWQPLSVLISLDVDQPPPLQGIAVSAQTPGYVQKEIAPSQQPIADEPKLPLTNPALDDNNRTDEEVLYKDPVTFKAPFASVRGKLVESPSVVIDKRRIKVGNDTYSLSGVTNVKIDFSIVPSYDAGFPSSRVVRALAWICGGFGILGIFADHTLLLFLIGALVSVYCAQRMSHTEQIQRTWVAKLMLGRSSQTDAILIATFHQHPSDEMAAWMINRGYVEHAPQTWREEFRDSRLRVQAIIDAVGLAIGT